MIIVAFVYSVLIFGAGYIISQKAVTTSDLSDKLSETGSKISRKDRRSSSSSSSTAVSVLNISSFPNSYEDRLLDKVATTMEKRLEKLLEGTYTPACKKLVRDTFEV